MWNDPLVSPKPDKRPPASKGPPAKKTKSKAKSKPKAKGPSTAKLVKDLALLKDQYKAQSIQLSRLTEIVAGMQMSQLKSSE